MANDIGKTLKEARKTNGLTVKFVSQYLTNKGFKASEKTVYSWENGNSEPSPDALLSLCELYNIQNILETFGYSKGNQLISEFEYDLIKKYREISEDSQRMIVTLIETEYHYKLLKDAEKNKRQPEEAG